MAQRSAAMRRSPAEWGVRGALAIAIAALGYVGIAQSLAYGMRGRNAERAHVIAPWDGRITAAFSQALSGPDATLATRRRADQLARLALRQDPTAVIAASTLGINTQIFGDDRGARRLIGYAQALSRRDLGTQIWLIESAVARGDIPGALRHYDIALRTSSESSTLLFPILASATNDPDIRTALVRTVAARPAWSSLFVEYVAANGPNPRATALLLRDLGQRGYPVAELSRTLLTDTLASRGLFDQAWAFYTSYRRGADQRSIRDPDFTAELANPTTFDWRPVTEAGISASLQRGVLSFTAPATVGGAVVEQTQMLPPGAYRIVGHSTGIDQPQASPYWRLQCRDGRELGRVDVPNSGSTGSNFAGKLIVPMGCPVQNLALMARPSDAISGVTGQIDHVRLSAWR